MRTERILSRKWIFGQDVAAPVPENLEIGNHTGELQYHRHYGALWLRGNIFPALLLYDFFKLVEEKFI
jgi:hypothetical protein